MKKASFFWCCNYAKMLSFMMKLLENKLKCYSSAQKYSELSQNIESSRTISHRQEKMKKASFFLALKLCKNVVIYDEVIKENTFNFYSSAQKYAKLSQILRAAGPFHTDRENEKGKLFWVLYLCKKCCHLW
jgi:hypothetical protein